MDVADLLKPRLPQDDHEIPGVGTVRFRALSREEAVDLQKVDDDQAEAWVLSRVMLDPVLTEEQVGTWRQVSTLDEINDVVDKVRALSGLNDDAAKEAVKEFAANPELEFRAPVGGEARDDGGSDAAGDAQ